MTGKPRALNQRPIPEPALADPDAVEMLRVWIAEQGLHCSMKIGMYAEEGQIAEAQAWAKILADTARHVAQALESRHAIDARQTLTTIREAFDADIDSSTTVLRGDFVRKH